MQWNYQIWPVMKRILLGYHFVFTNIPKSSWELMERHQKYLWISFEESCEIQYAVKLKIIIYDNNRTRCLNISGNRNWIVEINDPELKTNLNVHKLHENVSFVDVKITIKNIKLSYLLLTIIIIRILPQINKTYITNNVSFYSMVLPWLTKAG